MLTWSFFTQVFSLSLLNILIAITPNNSLEIESAEVVLIENSELIMSVTSDESYEFFKQANYNDIKQELIFETLEETVQIRIYDDLETMVYLLPIESQKIKIGRNLFESGKYRIIFDVDGDRRLYSSSLEVF